MLIQFGAAKDALAKENKVLDTKMSQAQKQIRGIESISLKECGLEGGAYEALEFRLKKRIAILKAHYVAYQEIQAANGKNINALDSLIAMDGKDAVDPNACERRIREAEEAKKSLLADAEIQKSRLWNTINNAADLYPEKGHVSTSPRAAMIRIDKFYGNSISVQDKIIEANQKALDAVDTYKGCAASVYEGARAKVTEILNRADELCRVHTKSENNIALFTTIDTDYQVAEIRAKIMVNGVVDEAYVKELFDKPKLTIYEKQALGMAFADLEESSRRGHGEQLNVFLNLGYENGSVRRVSYDSNTSSQAYLVERNMRPGFYEFLVYCSNPKCEAYSRYSYNKEFQDIKNCLFTICSSLLKAGNYTVLTFATSEKSIDYAPLDSDIDVRFKDEKKIVGEGKDVKEKDIKLLHINLKHDRIYIPSNKNNRDDNFFRPSVYFEVAYGKDVIGNAADMQGYYARNSMEDPASQAVYGATISGISSLVPFDKIFGSSFFGTLYDVADGGSSAFFDAVKNNENYAKIGNLGEMSNEAHTHFISQGTIVHAVGLEGINSSKTYLFPDQSDYEIRCDVQVQKDYNATKKEGEDFCDWSNNSNYSLSMDDEKDRIIIDELVNKMHIDLPVDDENKVHPKNRDYSIAWVNLHSSEKVNFNGHVY